MINKIIRNFIAKQIAGRSDDGIMITLKDPQRVTLGENIMADLLMRNGIDPAAITSENQLKLILQQIKNTEAAAIKNTDVSGIRGTTSAKVFDLEGKEIPEGSQIMGGKQVKNESGSLMSVPDKKGLAGMEYELQNKKAIDNLKQKMAKEKSRTQRISGNLRAENAQRYDIGEPKLDEDEYNYYKEILGEDAEYDYYPVKGDETKEMLEAMVKEQKDEMAYMKRLYDKGALDPTPEELRRLKDTETKEVDETKNILKKLIDEDTEDMAQGGRAGYMNGTLPMKKDGFLVSPDFSKMTPKEIELYKLQMEIMKKGFEKKPSPEGLEKLKIQQQIREQQRKDRGLPEEIQLMAQGGRAGFKSGLGKRFLELLKGKPKLKFDEKRFREGPISLEFLENIDKKDLAPFIRTRDTMGPGGYGMYDNFADMPAGLRAAELIKTIKTKDGGINYKAAELFLGKRLKGDESADELIQMLNRKEMRADGGRIGYKAGSIDKMRRLILKTIGAGTVGIGAAKSGIFSGFGKQAAKEVVKQSTSTPPAYFFELAGKIKTLGRMSDGPSERIKEFSMKAKDGKSELLLTEDIGTGEMQIKKIGKEGDDMITEVQTMDYTPGSAQADETTKGIPRDQYDEYTEYNSRIYKDEFNDPTIEDGIKVDEIIEEVKDQAPSIKKAGGGIARMLGE